MGLYFFSCVSKINVKVTKLLSNQVTPVVYERDGVTTVTQSGKLVTGFWHFVTS
jgi:hypothetical protein